MKQKLPELSRYELQCLKRLWKRGEATVREIQADLPRSPSYSTVRKILERLETKGAVVRVRREGKAWVYKSEVPASEITRKEIRRLLDSLFDGSALSLVSHLADMKELSVADLREIEEELGKGRRTKLEAKPREKRRDS